MRPRFERIYICLDACKWSFMVCRPMIGLDGCFIKTPYGDQLLIAIGWDPTDQILPIAYVVVEAEMVYIHERPTKGLIPTFDELLLDIDHRFCVRKFQLIGYPCEHAISCIRKMCLDVKNYVNKCYKKETYMDCYQHVIYPVNGPNLWGWTQNDDVLPPVFRKPIGRPKLSKNKDGDESRNNGPLSKLSRAGQQQKCSYYFALGHNKRTCPRKCKVEASAKQQNAAPQTKKSAGTTRTPNPARMQRRQQQKQQQNFKQEEEHYKL
ncbi:uncharacterized protein LOC107640929 [Arachis ipaensis]|uniref:uncharacterized protein LOC107640929 n=1 Tax=Arachis ipaensis TaxID=130454 RepID=UPI0007AF9255|nr:uncharacterized protein LOC107640929 [Arachis ipaensis]XP_025652871.1 uncharacterized protein LOC112748842 [Arachis hypogaea]